MNWSLARKRTALEVRARILQSIRRHFVEEGFLELETPLRIPAPAPESHIDAIPSRDWFLHTSPELCMKRLLASGYERIFQVCRCWRDAERGSRHLPEFTMLEWYRAEADYTCLMSDCEKLVRKVAAVTGVRQPVTRQGCPVNLDPSWERLTVRDAFARFSKLTMEQALASDRFDEVMSLEIEPNLGQTTPTFLCDYPAARAALARMKPGDCALAERFELYIAGVELANGFSELTDAVEQRRRFEAEEAYRRSRGRLPYPEPTPFLDELSTMPPSAGIALGIDRLVMLLLHASCIDDVVAFTPELL